MESFWIVLRESMYLVRFSKRFYDGLAVKSMTFKVYHGREISNLGGGPPYDWKINTDDCGPVSLLQHDKVDPVISGHVGKSGIMGWKLGNGYMRGHDPRHARDVGDIFASIYFFADRRMTLTGWDIPSLPEQVMEIPAKFVM